MAKSSIARRRFGAAGFGFLLLAAAAALLPPSVGALEMESLYTVDIELDTTATDPQNLAYEDALKAVLVRVTGDELAGENEDLLGLFPNPSLYVLQYRLGENETLVVTLDGTAIEALLRRANQPVWGSDRPVTLVWMAIDRGLGDREIVAASDGDGPRSALDRNRDLRDRVLAVAERRGIPLTFPLVDAEDLESISFSDIWGGFDRALIEASRRYGAASILVGRLRSDDPFGNRWTYYFGNQSQGWTGTPEAAVNLLADTLADRFAFAGNAPAETVTLTVTGVDSVAAYGSVQKLLRELTVVDGFTVDTVAGGQIRYRITVQGGSERLASALEFSGILQRSDWLDVEQLFPEGNTAVSLEYDYRAPDPLPAPGNGMEPDSMSPESF